MDGCEFEHFAEILLSLSFFLSLADEEVSYERNEGWSQTFFGVL